jgi:hypothetical protein
LVYQSGFGFFKTGATVHWPLLGRASHEKSIKADQCNTHDGIASVCAVPQVNICKQTGGLPNLQIEALEQRRMLSVSLSASGFGSNSGTLVYSSSGEQRLELEEAGPSDFNYHTVASFAPDYLTGVHTVSLTNLSASILHIAEDVHHLFGGITLSIVLCIIADPVWLRSLPYRKPARRWIRGRGHRIYPSFRTAASGTDGAL